MNRHRDSGNIMVLVLVCLAVMGISFYSLLEYAISQKRQTVKTNNILELKFALDSTVDFVLFGIKQKYCFSDILMSDVNCNMEHNGSVERLIMSPEQVSFLLTAAKVTSEQAEKLRLTKISRDLEIALVTPAHPLYNVINSLQRQADLGDIKFIHVDIERNDSAFLPRSGNEVYLRVTVSLSKTRSSATTVSVGNEKLQVTSNLVIYPREVGSFALLVPQRLHLGSNDQSPAFGDTHFYGASGGRAQFAGKPGLVFLSPVFVNRDIILNSSAYSPVTFADRVYLGEGRVMTGAGPFKPENNGDMKSRYWRDVDSFGGFLRGIENDGAQDAGLNVFVGKTAGVDGVVPNEQDMAACIDHNLSQADLRKILDSTLRIQLNENNLNQYRYTIGLTESEFEGQRMDPRLWTNDKWGFRPTLDVDDGRYRRVIMNVKVALGDRVAEFSMSKQTEFKSAIAVGSQGYENKLSGNVEAAKAKVETAKAKVADAKKAYEEAQAAYDAGGENATVTLDDLERLRQGVIAAEKEQAATEQNRDAAVAFLEDYRFKVANPPQITVQTEPFLRSSGRVSDAKVNFNVTVTNPSHMLDSEGKLVSPDFSIKAFDSSYIEGDFIGKKRNGWRNNRPDQEKDNSGPQFPENTKLERTLNFTVNPATGAVQVPVGDGMGAAGEFENQGDRCRDIRGALDSQAFGMVDANVSFAKSTRISWNFAGTGMETPSTKKDPLVSSLVFDANNAVAGQGVTSFQVRSIVGTCTIKGSANFVTGFFACNKLVIEARSTPLRIIGTFIAGNVFIDPSAYDAGIIWSSIYHPQAVAELRNERILKKTSTNGTCLSTPDSPIWNPVPSIQDVADRMTCNVISLRAKADPFQWTAVDPDCGLLPGKSNTSCKKRLVRFFVVEQSREGAR